MNHYLQHKLKHFFQWHWLLVLLGVLVVFWPFLVPGFPITHDGQNHLPRFANYKIAVREGQFPPRWAPNLLQGYGYPVFNYNYPLANLMSLPFSVLDISYQLTLKIEILTALVVGVLGMNAWILQFAKGEKGRTAATLAWLFNPYFIYTLYVRGSIGEVMAYCLLPWVLWIIDAIKKEQTSWPSVKRLFVYSVIGAAFLLSHNVAAVFFVPIAAVYALIQYKNNWNAWLQLIVTSVVSAAHTLWFWLPAVQEMKYVTVTQTDLTKTAMAHLLQPWQIFSSSMSLGFSHPGSIDGVIMGVGIVIALILLLYFCTLMASWLALRSKPDTDLVLLSLLLVTVLVFTSELSRPVWDKVGFLHVMQFPWRLGIYASVLSTPLLIWLLRQRLSLINWLVYAGVAFLIAVTVHFDLNGTINQTNLDYDVTVLSTSTINENRALSFTLDLGEPRENTPIIFTGAGTVDAIKWWNGSSRQYQITITEPAVVMEPTMRFPGWETTVYNGTSSKKVPHYDDQDIKGRIAYQLSPGAYTVTTRFTQNTWPRLVGNTVSLVSMLVVGVLFVKETFRSKRHK